MANPYYTPQGIAPILAEGARTQSQFLAQPAGLSQALPALGNVAQAGFNVAAQNRQRMNVLQAQQVYSDYLAKLDAGTATPQDHQQGYAAALSLGINPKPPTATAVVSPEVLGELKGLAGVSGDVKGTKENVAGLEKVAALKKKPTSASAAAEPMKTAKMWQQQMNLIIPTIARRGSPLGIAAVNNQRKDRLLEIAKNPSPTPQEVKLMETDLAGVMQGGSPQEDTLRATHYGSIAQDWASLKGRLTGTPQDANSKEIVAKLKEIALGVGAVDNKVIVDNLHMVENYPSMRYLIKKDPQGWEGFRKVLLSTIPGQVDDSGAAPSGTPQTPTQNNKDPMGLGI